jgi:hypothetical protein
MRLPSFTFGAPAGKLLAHGLRRRTSEGSHVFCRLLFGWRVGGGLERGNCETSVLGGSNLAS